MRTAPYQWLFPIGFLGGLGGVALWIPFGLIPGNAYPGVLHAQLMILGFFLPVAGGFLLTAMPHFLAAAPASRTEVALLCLSACGILGAVLAQRPAAPFGLAGLMLLQLAGFALRRLRHAPRAAPAPFALLACGLALGGVGSLLGWWHAAVAPLRLAAAGHAMLVYGFPLAVVLGVGSDILPMFLGLGQRPAPVRPAGTRLGYDRAATRRFAGYGAALCLSFAGDAWLARLGAVAPGALLRAIVTTAVLHREWRLCHCWRVPGYLARAVTLSAWATLAGVWGAALLPQYALHAAHGFFVGGISLLIFAVASRVILAHGGHDLQLERRSWAMLTLMLGMTLALLTRLAAPFTSNYAHHLAYAALAWCIAVAGWSWIFVPRLLRTARNR